MRNGFKKVAVTVMSMSLAFALFAIPVSAGVREQSRETEVTVSPRAALCPNCGGIMSDISTVWGDWYATGQQNCTHGYPWGTDLVLKRTGVKTTKCSSCGLGTSETVSDSKTECHGYN